MSNHVYICAVIPEALNSAFTDPETGETFRLIISTWTSWELADSHGQRMCTRQPGAVYYVAKSTPNEFEEKPHEFN